MIRFPPRGGLQNPGGETAASETIKLETEMTKTRIFRFFATTAFVAIVACAVAAAQNTTSAEIEKWKAAAEKGEAWAQYNLGVAYSHGNGVAEDKREAVRWVP